MNFQHCFAFLFIVMVYASCARGVKPKPPIEINHAAYIQTRLFDENQKFDNHFYGFVLYDPETKDTLLNINGDKYFTPASNTKLLTFLLSKKVLGKHLIGLEYVERDGGLFFRGTGDPGFLADSIYGTQVLDFLKDQKEDLYFDASNYKDKRLGAGWAWDDSKYLYQKNKSVFPIYGNQFDIIKTDSTTLKILPKFFQDSIFQNPSRKYASRDLHSNVVSLDTFKLIDWSYPIYQSDDLMLKLLTDTLGLNVRLIESEIIDFSKGKTVNGSPADSLFKNLLLYSDNYIAEQLLLNVSQQELGYMNTHDIIDYALDTLLLNIPDRPRWVDGSGLSRYNLVTPRSMIWILQEIQGLLSVEEIKYMFPSGKKGDTLPMKYDQDYFIYAKTGTLSNNHNISGYLFTKSDKQLIFSFMNNHYLYPKKELVPEMKRILEYVRDNF